MRPGGNTAVDGAALERGSGGFGVMGRQVIAQKQMWHGTDLPNLRAGISASSRRGRRRNDPLGHVKTSWLCSGFFRLIILYFQRGGAGGGPRAGVGQRRGARPPPARGW